MNKDDDTQKEKIIIPSFGGAKEVSKEISSNFQLLDPEDLILEERGLSLVASAPRGLSPVDGRLDPSRSSLKK